MKAIEYADLMFLKAGERAENNTFVITCVNCEDTKSYQVYVKTTQESVEYLAPAITPFGVCTIQTAFIRGIERAKVFEEKIETAEDKTIIRRISNE